jgi:hypothetical protein
LETYSNFKQLASQKMEHLTASISLMWHMRTRLLHRQKTPKTPIKNTFVSLCARLVLDVLSGKESRDYSCGIKVDEAFETAVHELRAYFGFFKLAILARTCESILRFYSYDGVSEKNKKIHECIRHFAF